MITSECSDYLLKLSRTYRW